MDFVPLFLHVRILQSEEHVSKELMDLAFGLLGIRILMVQMELASRIHHAAV